MTAFDVFALVVLIVSAMAGFVRGGAREIVTLFAFLFAGLMAALALPLTAPLGRKLVDPDFLGTIAAFLVVAVLVYAIVRLVGAWAGQKLRQTERLGGLDRSVGVGFGVARTLVFLGMVHLLMFGYVPHDRIPGWYRGAAVYPVSVAAAKGIQAILPGGARLADKIAPKVEHSVRVGASSKPHSKSKERAEYDRRERDRMDALVEKSR
ncbi:CvpA family protein [Caulobacter sp. 17J80-11]|uniref:CvpA family protein n=1 Tax=Caulobacter sp. 17J80-11 TaxID=2763502 RepID=UPI001653AD1D|nr:CvpA family protein [Caulobacter sp. 17J80-11]MBC6982999.1 CvpA family protein [Caulobacter sp. 17J80-11]